MDTILYIVIAFVIGVVAGLFIIVTVQKMKAHGDGDSSKLDMIDQRIEKLNNDADGILENLKAASEQSGVNGNLLTDIDREFERLVNISYEYEESQRELTGLKDEMSRLQQKYSAAAYSQPNAAQPYPNGNGMYSQPNAAQPYPNGNGMYGQPNAAQSYPNGNGMYSQPNAAQPYPNGNGMYGQPNAAQSYPNGNGMYSQPNAAQSYPAADNSAVSGQPDTSQQTAAPVSSDAVQLKMSEVFETVRKLRKENADYRVYNPSKNNFEYSSDRDSKFILYNYGQCTFVLPNQIGPFNSKQVAENVYKCDLSFISDDNSIIPCIVNSSENIVKQGEIF
ncbi:MAG: nucleoporin [Ruminococcus sp.]|nr:nucleoporin [Ruminococcus sp.]